MSPWSINNTEAFAGLHNQNKRLLLVMDEASAIADSVWEVAEGALTDKNTQIIWIAFGNPTKATGRFRECFDDGKFAHRWLQFTVDSREARTTNKQLIEDSIADYGLDHDFVRVRWLGLFPRHDVDSFISRAMVIAALNREAMPDTAPVILGVDVARKGNDSSVIFPRQGRDAKSRPLERFQQLDTMEVAAKVAEASHRYGASLIFVDETGVGGGVLDRLRELRFPAYGVDFGSGAAKTTSGVKYANKRAEIWGSLRDAMPGLALQHHQIDKNYSILDDLITTNYGINDRGEILLEKKADIKAREGYSPDVADALALTYAFPSLAVAPSAMSNRTQFRSSINYNPYEKVH
jgi:hypothetical protein